MAEAFISGRSRATAQALIAAAKEAGVDAQRIRTSTFPPGYYVPNKVAKAYQSGDEAVGSDNGPIDSDNAATDSDAPDDESKQEPEAPTTGDGTQESGQAPEDDANTGSDDDVDPQPPGNASQAAWADWARRNKGYDESEGLTRDQLKTRFGA